MSNKNKTTSVEAVESAAVVAEKKSETKTVTKAESVVYIGPSITHIVRHANVFKDGKLPQAVENTINEFPVMEALFVPLSKLQEKMLELKRKSALANIYGQVAEKFK